MSSSHFRSCAKVDIMLKSGELMSTVQLNQGTIELDQDQDDEEERLVIPIKSSPELHLGNLDSGIEVIMSGESVGDFTGFNIGDYCPFRAKIDEYGNAHLTIFVAKYSVRIRGPVNGLRNETMMKISEGYDAYRLSTFGMFAHDNGATFKPTSIAMDLTDTLKETLHMIGNATKSGNVDLKELTPSDELRRLTLAALGDDKDKKMMEENKLLKLQRKALLGLKNLLLRVDISHNGGMASFSLEEGELMNDEDGIGMWRYYLWEKENATMGVNCIKVSSFSVSGVKVQRMHYLRSNLRDPLNRLVLRTENNPIFGVRIPYAPGIEVYGAFNWDEHSEEEISNILDQYFHTNLDVAMNQAFVGPGTFPPSFKIKLFEVRFNLQIIRHIFNLAGMSNEIGLLSNNKNIDVHKDDDRNE